MSHENDLAGIRMHATYLSAFILVFTLLLLSSTQPQWLNRRAVYLNSLGESYKDACRPHGDAALRTLSVSRPQCMYRLSMAYLTRPVREESIDRPGVREDSWLSGSGTDLLVESLSSSPCAKFCNSYTLSTGLWIAIPTIEMHQAFRI